MTALHATAHVALAEAQPRGRLGPAANLAELGIGGVLVVAYLAITRIGHLEAAKIGVQIGPVPLFLTEMFMIGTILVAALTRPAAITCWLTTGGMARAPGLLLWLLFLTSIVYAVAAFDQWGILAIRDLAIFSYGIVFALSYVVIDTREKAAAAMRWFTYSGVILALALIVDTVSGAHLLFLEETRIVTDALIVAQSFGGGDVGGIISFSLIALIAYAVSTGERRGFHLACIAICVYALTIAQTRSAAVGLFLGLLYTAVGMTTTQRMSFIGVIAAGLIAFTAIPILMPQSHLAEVISTYTATVQGGVALAGDDNFYFRLLRWDKVFEIWRDNPVFGAGFGRPLIPAALLNEVENGGFNAGLPHNTYLTVLARMGLFGFVLVIGAWITSIVLATRAIARERFGADAFAAGTALVAMMGFATFVLFLERPMHAATLWIIAAVACRLAEPDAPRGTPSPSPTAAMRQPMARHAEAPIERARRIARAKGFK
jgi:O-antigen ligase